MNAIFEFPTVSLIEEAGLGMSWGGTVGEVGCDSGGRSPSSRDIGGLRGMEKSGICRVIYPIESVVFSSGICSYMYAGG